MKRGPSPLHALYSEISADHIIKNLCCSVQRRRLYSLSHYVALSFSLQWHELTREAPARPACAQGLKQKNSIKSHNKSKRKAISYGSKWSVYRCCLHNCAIMLTNSNRMLDVLACAFAVSRQDCLSGLRFRILRKLLERAGLAAATSPRLN